MALSTSSRVRSFLPAQPLPKLELTNRGISGFYPRQVRIGNGNDFQMDREIGAPPHMSIMFVLSPFLDRTGLLTSPTITL